MTSSTFKKYTDKIVGGALVALMSLMVLNVTWQVLSRYIFQNPASFTDELSRYMLIWLGMLGSAYVAGQNDHLAIDIILKKLEGKPRVNLQIIINSLVMVFALAVMVLGGSNLVYITYILEQHSATLQIPLALIYSIIPISGVLVIYYQIAHIFACLKTQNQSS